MSDDRLSRRRVLQGLGVGGVAGLAGCQGLAEGTLTAGDRPTVETPNPDGEHHDACPAVEYVLNTGYDQDAGGLLDPNTADDDWDITGDDLDRGPVPRDATVVDNIHWPSAFADSRWISIDESRGSPLPSKDTQFEYTYCFCLREGFRNPELSIKLQADDVVDDVRLNGNSLPYSGNGNFQQPPIEETYTDPDYFQAGENCLTIVVRDKSQVVTAMNLVGTMTADNADCDCVCTSCDLSVEKRHEGDFRFGGQGSYVVEVCNDGSEACTRGVVVRDELPDGLSFAAASGQDWVVSEDGGTVTATHPNADGLAPGECLPPLKIVVDVGAAGQFPADQETIRNCAAVLSGQDGDADNDEDCDEITCVEGTVTVEGGVDDEYAGGNDEPTSPSEGLQERINAPIRDFDEGGINKPFAHTFDVPQPPLAGEICGAELSFRARPDGPGDYNDFLSLGLWHDDGTKDDDYSWGESLGQNNGSGLFDVQWSSGQTGSHETTLDLSALPNPDNTTTDLLAALRQHGRLDVMIHDDTVVDYMHLTVTYCCDGGSDECQFSIDKRAATDFAFGETGAYVIEVCNESEAECEGAFEVTDELPDGIKYVRGAGAGWSISEQSGTVVATPTRAFAPGECREFEIEVEVVPEDEWPHDRPVVENCARFRHAGRIVEDCVEHEIGGGGGGGECQLTMDKRVRDQFHYGDTGLYVLEVCNEGEAECNGTIRIEDDLPEGLEYGGAEGQGWSVNYANGTIVAKHANNGGLAPGECLPLLYIQVRIPPADEWPGDSDEITNTAALFVDDQFLFERGVTHTITKG